MKPVFVPFPSDVNRTNNELSTVEIILSSLSRCAREEKFPKKVLMCSE